MALNSEHLVLYLLGMHTRQLHVCTHHVKGHYCLDVHDGSKAKSVIHTPVNTETQCEILKQNVIQTALNTETQCDAHSSQD